MVLSQNKGQNVLLIGDVHGHNKDYLDILEEEKPDFSVQLGDFGFGFGHDIKEISENNYFLRGNHDDPAACRKHLSYLGDYGMHEKGFFWISGALSIDKKWRLDYEVINNRKIWWKDEELPLEEHDKILELYIKEKPSVVLSHECPKEIVYLMGNTLKMDIHSRTGDGLLPLMFEAHKPDIWVFGHHHISFDKVVKGTRFKCLTELETFVLE